MLRKDAAASAENYAALVGARGSLIAFFFDSLAVDWGLGLLTHTMCNFNQAVAHFEDALAFCRPAGYRPELGWACCDYADRLLQRNEPGDHEKTTSLLHESLSISSELGMRRVSPGSQEAGRT